MEQEYKNVCIIGGGASGCVCAYFLLTHGIDVTIFDKYSFLRTILPTGGGRCNLAHAEYDFKELAKNYPRGEKFLYSVFSKFGTTETIDLFNKIGIKTYIQDDGRIFPESNSSKDVKEKILQNIKNAKFVKEEVIKISKLNDSWKINSNKGEYLFTDVIIAIGGHSGLNLIKESDIKTIEQKPSLVGLNTKENFKEISGITVKNVKSDNLCGDILFTHFGISGPLTYKISSINAYKEYPYSINFDLLQDLTNFQDILNKNPHKDIKNILGEYLPQRLGEYILKNLGINTETKAHQIDGKTRDLILDKLHNYSVTITSPDKGEETVSAGGIDLNEINPKTMELKRFPHLYAIGEILNIDGFCGGFNLQNAWSTAYICATSLL